MSLQRREVSRADGLCIKTRATARDALKEQPHRGCVAPPAQLFGLDRLSQSSQSSEGGWGELQACPRHPGPNCSATEPSAAQPPQSFPQCLLVLLGLGMNQQEKGVLFLPLWTSPLFCHTETGTKELKSWWMEILTSAEGWAICFWMEGRGWILGTTVCCTGL